MKIAINVVRFSHLGYRIDVFNLFDGVKSGKPLEFITSLATMQQSLKQPNKV